MDENKENGNSKYFNGLEEALDHSSTRSEHSSIFAESFLEFIRNKELLPSIPNGFEIRALRSSDYRHGFLELLAQLTTVGEVTPDMYKSRFVMMRDCSPPTYYVIVIEEIDAKRIVATATLVLEWKFIHEAGCRGRIEEIIVDRNMHDHDYFREVLCKYLVALANHIGVYKLSVECEEDLTAFYESLGFKKDVENSYLTQTFVIPPLDPFEKES